MKRYEKFVLEAEKGITFRVKKGVGGELKIKALNRANVYSGTYANPPIPEGYKHICGEWNDGFVIERDSDGSQFVWVPVGYLDSNGALDGISCADELLIPAGYSSIYVSGILNKPSYTEKFGRRTYYCNVFEERFFHEPSSFELAMQVENVREYGGFYISRYNISKSSKGKPQSVKGVMPWVNINFEDAREVASTIEDNRTVESHLTFGAEYDSVLEWFIESNARTRSEIEEDSTNWGNHENTENSPKKVVETGSREAWCTNNIYDFSGNVSEWTQEKYENKDLYYYVLRGGNYQDKGIPVAARDFTTNSCFDCIGFRATLYIK